jgi:hypothetical protein
MSSTPNFTEALRRQREAFADRYAANAELAETQEAIDAMFADDEAAPIENYAERRGE